MAEMRYPDFYIVGAPKCGTTAMYDYLRQHPQLFMPDRKEPLYFGSDLEFRLRRRPTGAPTSRCSATPDRTSSSARLPSGTSLSEGCPRDQERPS